MVGVVAQSFPKKSYKMKKSLAPQKRKKKRKMGSLLLMAFVQFSTK